MGARPFAQQGAASHSQTGEATEVEIDCGKGTGTIGRRGIIHALVDRADKPRRARRIAAEPCLNAHIPRGSLIPFEEGNIPGISSPALRVQHKLGTREAAVATQRGRRGLQWL
jgi:hypothetical protein